MKGFIEVSRVIGDKIYKKIININNIIDIKDHYITTRKILNYHHAQTVYVQENREEIEKLIKQATEL